MRVELLADHPALVGVLAAWFEAEWGPWYGPDGPGDALEDLRASARREGLPLGLVALDDGGPVGTVSLRADSISHPELGPWGAALLVAPSARGRGLAEALVQALEEHARRLGHARLYMSTQVVGPLLERRGWCPVDTAGSLRGPVVVYALELRAEPPACR